MPADYWAPLFAVLGGLQLTGGGVEFVLDFDGTIAPIVPIPSRADVNPRISAVLPRIVEDATLTIISGRPAAFLLEKLAFLATVPGASSVTLYGHYGLEAMDLAGRAISKFEADPAELELLRQVRDLWMSEPISGILFEDKESSVALHFRNAPERREEVLDWLEFNLPMAGLTVRPGKMVYEITPSSSPTKEDIVLGVAARGELAIFAGDDVGDVGVFRLFRAERARGLSRLSVLIKGGIETPPELLGLCDVAVPGPNELAWVLDQINRATSPKYQKPDA